MKTSHEIAKKRRKGRETEEETFITED